MAGNAFLKQPANHVEWFGGMFLEFRLESLETKLLTPSIRGLEQTVGVKSEDRSWFGANRGTYKLSGWKNAQRQVWAFQLDHLVGLWEKSAESQGDLQGRPATRLRLWPENKR